MCFMPRPENLQPENYLSYLSGTLEVLEIVTSIQPQGKGPSEAGPCEHRFGIPLVTRFQDFRVYAM